MICTKCGGIVYECRCEGVEKVVTQGMCKGCGQPPPKRKALERRKVVQRRKGRRRTTDG